MSQQPALPEPAHPSVDSMLARKFGREVANYFSGSPLNRVSFLRSDYKFLSLALHHPTTSFLLFDDLKPLTKNSSGLAFTTFNDVLPLIGNNPYEKSEDELIEGYNSTQTVPQMIFLGLDEKDKDGFVYKEVYKGAPLWAVDVTPRGSHGGTAKALIKEMEGRGLSFMDARMILSFPAPEAAIYAQARSLLDWNARNPFCGSCGQPTMSVNAGGKRVCPPKDSGQMKGAIGSTSPASPMDPMERPPCASRGRISNLQFPRTDPTVIMVVVSSDGQKVLLGRQKRFPPYWFSTLAGFIEPAESIEEAVRREVYEEAGVTCGRVVIHSSQPWPYPANLMIGAIAQAIPSGEKIDLGNDPELDDAKWFSFDDVREALRVGTSGLGEPAGPGYKEGNLRLPPPTAIANRLISSIVEDNFAGGTPRM